MKTKLTTLAASGLLATALTAGEPMMPYTPSAPMAPAFSWTGAYFGLQAGVNFDTDTDGGLVFDSDLDGRFNDNVTSGPNQGGNNAFGNNFDHEFDEDFSYGVVAGYDVQFNQFVLGALIDYNSTNILESQTGFSATPAFYKEERTIENLANLRLRAGYLVTDRTLFYLTGGLAYGDPEYRFNSNNPNGISSGDNDGDFGYVLGAGVETRITQNWSFTVEYLFTDFGSGDFSTSFNNGPFASEANFTNTRGSDQDFDFQSVQVKVTYRF